MASRAAPARLFLPPPRYRFLRSTGDILASKFATLERGAGADEELLALKRKMGMLPPEEAAPAAEAEVPKRVVEAPSGPAGGTEQDELAAALEEMEAEQVEEQQRKAGR